MERGGNSGGAPMSNGHHRGMLAHYGRASVHLELSSFEYKYGAAPHRLRDGFTYAHPLLTLDMRDLDRVSGHVSKFNGLSYLVRRSLLNPPGGRATTAGATAMAIATTKTSTVTMGGGGGQRRRRQRRTARDAV